MGSNLLVLWPLLFDVHQFAFLLVVANRVLSGELLACLVIVVVGMTPDAYLVGIAALLQARVVEFATPIKHPLQFVGCMLVRVDAIFKRFDTHRTLFLRDEWLPCRYD